MKNPKTIVAALVLAAMLVLLALMVMDLVPLLQQILKNRDNEAEMVGYIEAYGTKGVPILIGLLVLQVIVAVIPSTPIQMLAGLCYGVFYGTLICVVGCVAGNALLFFVLRLFGRALTPLFERKPKKSRKKNQVSLNLDKITNARHPEQIAFLLYLIPFVPSGILPYLFVRSRITFPRFLLAVTAASIPSALLCNWLGERIAKGDYKTVVILAVVLLVIIGGALLFRNQIIKQINKRKDGARRVK